MPPSYRIVLHQPLPEVDGTFCGEALLRELADLDWTAKEIAVRPLSGFCSSQMFSPEEGLCSVRALIREIGAWVVGQGQTDDLLRDLRACEHILSAAKENDTKWHFEIEGGHASEG